MRGEPHVLVVAGSDSSGGAGIARDIETIAAYGLKSCVAITAVTVQTHGKVRHVAPVEPEIVADQMRAALEANDVAAIKIGMLARAETIAAVADVLTDCAPIPVVLDPVLAASAGRALLDPDALHRMRALLFPHCALLTPNRPELARLAGEGVVALDDESAILQGKRILLANGARAVLAKGGHATGDEAVDILLQGASEPQVFAAPRLAVNLRGTGCMLSSAIAAGLAGGLELSDAIAAAKQYLSGKLAARSSIAAPQ